MWLGDALPGFLAWWAGQLRDIVPLQWRSLGAARPNGLVVQVASLAADPPAVALTLHRRGRASSLGEFVLDEAGLRAARAALARCGRIEPVALQLPPAALLDREAVLPLAAERDLGRVLHYEMDRLTPFAAEDVFWNCAIERRDRALGRLQVAVWLVPKAALLPLLAALGRIGVVPSALHGRFPARPDRTIELRRVPSRNERWRRRALQAGAIVCCGLALAAVALPFLRQSVALNEVEARIAALRPKVAEVEALRRRMTTAQAGGDVLAAERARLGDALQALAVVTDLLPDDTYLSEFVLRERKLTLNGQSTAAPKLIAALSTDPAIRNPAFIAPVTRTEEGHDVFAIRADLAP